MLELSNWVQFLQLLEQLQAKSIPGSPVTATTSTSSEITKNSSCARKRADTRHIPQNMKNYGGQIIFRHKSCVDFLQIIARILLSGGIMRESSVNRYNSKSLWTNKQYQNKAAQSSREAAKNRRANNCLHPIFATVPSLLATKRRWTVQNKTLIKELITFDIISEHNQCQVYGTHTC